MDTDNANDDTNVGTMIPLPSKEPAPAPSPIIPGDSHAAALPADLASGNYPINGSFDRSSLLQPPATNASEEDIEIILQDDKLHTIPSHLKATVIPATDKYHITGMNGL